VTPDFIPQNLLPPNSLDLNVVDYKMWGMLRYKTKIKDIHKIRERILDEWDKLD